MYARRISSFAHSTPHPPVPVDYITTSHLLGLPGLCLPRSDAPSRETGVYGASCIVPWRLLHPHAPITCDAMPCHIHLTLSEVRILQLRVYVSPGTAPSCTAALNLGFIGCIYWLEGGYQDSTPCLRLHFQGQPSSTIS